MDNAAKRHCTHPSTLPEERVPIVPELNSSFDPMSAQQTEYMTKLIVSQINEKMNEKLAAQAKTTEAASTDSTPITYLKANEIYQITTTPLQGPFPTVASLASKDKNATKQKPQAPKPPATIDRMNSVPGPTDPAKCSLPPINSSARASEPSKTKEFTVHVPKTTASPNTSTTKTSVTSSPTTASPNASTTKTTSTSTASTSTQKTSVSAFPTASNASVPKTPSTSTASTSSNASTPKIPITSSPTTPTSSQPAVPEETLAKTVTPEVPVPSKKREHTAISQSPPKKVVIEVPVDSETESDCDLQDDLSLEVSSISVLDYTPTTSSLEASTSLGTSPITISIPKNILQCEFTPQRFLSHPKSYNEEFLVGMTPMQLLYLKNIRNFLRNLLGASFDYSFDDRSIELLSLRRYRYNKDNRIPFLVKSTSCKCKFCERGVMTKDCYSEVRVSFLLPFVVVAGWSAKETETNWLSGEKEQDMPIAFSNAHFQPRYAYTIRSLNAVSFDICLFAKSASRLGAGIIETADDLFTAMSNYMMALINPYIQKTLNASPSFEEWVASNPHIVIQKDVQDSFDY